AGAARRAHRPGVRRWAAAEDLRRDREVEGDDLVGDEADQAMHVEGIIRTMAFLPLDGTRGRRDAAAMHAEILLFDGFDELDALGPWEVLARVAAVRDDSPTRLVTLEGAREVRADHGAVIRAQAALSEHPDVVIVPGGGWVDRTDERAWAQARRGEIPRALAERHAAGALIASVCTGALLLAHA